jgi:hypothetical protein
MVALPKIGFNEGSLLRRTLLHVGTFLFGSVAFIALVSFVLVTVARSVVAPRGEATAEDEPEVLASASPAAAPKAARPPAGKGRGKRNTAAVTPTAAPAKDE